MFLGNGLQSNNMNKKNIYILIFVVIGLLLFPLVLNFILLQEAFFPVVGGSVTWLSFWPTYLSTIVSLGMIILTYKSLKQNQKQIIMFEKQREEENRARICTSIIVHETAFYLKLKNIGKTNASRVNISVNQDYIDTLSDRDKIIIEDFERPFYIEANKSVYIFLGWCKDVNEKYKDQDIVLQLSGFYYSSSVKYPINEELRLSEFINKMHFVVRGDLETTLDHIKRRLVVQNDSHHPIQISLENIEHSLRDLSQQIKKYVEREPSNISTKIEVYDDKEVSTNDDID